MTKQEQLAREMAEKAWDKIADELGLFPEDHEKRDAVKIILRKLNLVALLEDKAIVDHIETLRCNHFAHWAEFGEWVNPSVSWSFRHTGKDGTYNFPKELHDLTFRTAITNAMKQEEGK